MANINTERSNPSPTILPNRLISRDDAAANLGITTRYLDNLIRLKKIAVTRIGARVLVSCAELERFIEQNTERQAVSA
jgi:excisionase family DNA binding protein